jgi:hypothetical protein
VDGSNSDGTRSYLTASQTLVGGTTAVAGSSQHYYPTGSPDRYVPINSFCMPVTSGTSYELNFTSTFGSPIPKAFFIPLADTLYFFSQLSNRTAGIIYTAQTDGFLLAYIYNSNDGDRGLINAYSFNDANLLETQGLVTSTSIHYYPNGDTYVGQNTLMIPVPKGNSYKVELINTFGSCQVSINWVSIGVNPA